jgi:hypothetical protein
MPDTYISQFSGEEIDAALRAAQIISGASTPAELRKKLEIRGDTIPVSAEDSTLISGALKYRTNPNLLDNWYFGNPVNQRSGYYIPAGVKYNTLSWTEAGTTDKAYPVIGYSGQDPLITVNGTNYIVGKSAQVPGYCGEWVYTIDRWEISEGTLTVNDGSISHSGGQLFHPLSDELSAILKGKRLTLSFLYADGSLESASAVVPSTWGTWDAIIDYASIRIFGVNNGSRLWVTNVSSAPILAAKLELGDTQTLAHQDSSGNWILNEIPDFGEQLRRCQLYRWRFCPAEYVGSAIAFGISANAARALIYLPEQMRTNPTLNFNKNTGLFLTGVDGDIFGMTLALVWTSPNSICVEFQKSGAFAPNSVYFVRGDGSSAIDISADL